MSAKTSKDKVYRLLNGTPLSYTLPSRNHPRFPLMHFDEAKNVNRALRYAVNQKSPFEDEQDNNPILEPIVFEDGFLRVSRTNPVLQEFLHYHPLYGKTFVELDKEKEAEDEVKMILFEADALEMARSLDTNQIEILTRVVFGKDPSMSKTAELKRDLLVFARQEPQEFMSLLNDPDLNFQAKVRMYFEKQFLTTRNNDREVWFNTKTNKKKMLTVPFDSTPFEAACQYLKTDDGIDALKMLDANVDL